MPVPHAELAAGTLQYTVECLHQCEVRTEPTAVETSVTPGHPEEDADDHDCGQEGPQDDLEGRLVGGDLAGPKGVDTQRPALAQEPQLGLDHVEAQQVQGRCQQEQGEESELKKKAAALHGVSR